MPSSVILDPAADKNRAELVNLARSYAFPDFVLAADLDATMNPPQVALTAFGDPVRGKFACHTPAATWLSALYLLEKNASYSPDEQRWVLGRMARFADYFRIRPQYDNLLKQAALQHKRGQLPDSAFAYVWQDETGKTERFYPLTDALATKTAADWLFANRDRMPFSVRHVVGKKIHKAACQFGANLGEALTQFIERQAGRGVPDPPQLYRMLQERSQLAKTAEMRERLSDLTASVRGVPHIVLQGPQLVKLADTLDAVDQALGLIGRYTDAIPRPEDIVFGVTFTKAAAEHEKMCVLQTGNGYNHDQLSKIARADLEQLFGDDFAREVCTGLDVDAVKLANVAHTLPRGDAELLESLLTEQGENPQLAKFASCGALQNIGSAELKAAAASYRN